MNPKMLFFDIDGTLITEGSHILPDSTKKALALAKANGHLLFINTGRTYFNIEQSLRDLGFDGYVCGCGTYIYLHDEIIFSRTIPHDTCVQIIEMLRECNIDALFEENSYAFFDSFQPATTSELIDLRARFGTKSVSIPSSLDNTNFTFDKFVLWMNTRSDSAKFHQFIEKDFDYIDRGNNFAEVVMKGTSKATGIQMLMDHLHFPLKDCYVFGDSTNDLPMLKYVPNSVAMGNSMKAILPYCSYQTSSVLEDGIYHALQHFNLI